MLIVLEIMTCFLGLLALLCQLLKAAAETTARRQQGRRNAARTSDHQRPAVGRWRLLRRRRRRQLRPARRRRRRRRQLQPARRRRGLGHRVPRRAVLEEGDAGLAEMVVARRSNVHGRLQQIREPAGPANHQAAEYAPPTPSAELVIGRFAWRFPEARNTMQEQTDPSPSELV